MAEEAKDQIGQGLALLAEVLPALAPGSPAERLGRSAEKGLGKLEAIIDLELDVGDVKQMRLIGDMSLGVCKLFQRAAEGAFRAQEGNALLQLLEQLKAQQSEKTVVDQGGKK